jgi:Holliday junction resolvase-like predicted endonuclease
MLSAEEVLKSLRPEEVVLILALRNKFRYGEVNVLMRDGIPQRLLKVEIFVDLKEKNPDAIAGMLQN